MKDTESGDEVRLMEMVVRINEPATKLRIIKSVAEKWPVSFKLAGSSGFKLASCLY